MTSAGGLVSAAAYHAKDSLLSGPAGGVVGAVDAGRRSGFARLIAFDMGGTSTDVSRFGGDELEYVYEHRVGDARLVAPALSIETVAAGGGSICAFDGHRLTVGPHSAGARPGPACYGAGGPLTVTDVNLLLGRLDASRFGIPIDLAAARAAAEALAATVAAAGAGHAQGEPIEPLLEGLLAIADERMADAIRSISLRRGYDPAGHALVAFGGAGGQHACAVAELLGIRTVLVPEDAGLLSAVGLGAAVVERFAQRQVLAPLSEVAGEIDGWLDTLAAEARAAVAAEGVTVGEVVARRRLVSLRLAGQESSLEVEPAEGVTLAGQFAERYRHLYGYPPADRPLEVESLRAIASSRRPERAAGQDVHSGTPGGAAPAMARRSLWLGGRWHDGVPVAARAQMPAGATLDGPALVVDPHGATLVPAGWQVALDPAGGLRLLASPPDPSTH
jgi:5-oxoprolinase (ATP-hydrolysing)